MNFSSGAIYYGMTTCNTSAMNIKYTFDETKAAEVAAFFLAQVPNTPMKLIKLMKLMYLAERRSFELFQEPMIGDRLVSMKYGPVLSNVKTLMDGYGESASSSPWEQLISDRAQHRLGLRDKSIADDPDARLLHLSESDLEILKEVWNIHGSRSPFDLVEFTHQALPEWTDPGESMIPISLELLMKTLGYGSEATNATIERVREQSVLKSLIKN